MTAGKNPAALFYWNDWEDDKELRACSMAAQGLWMRMLCIAARASRTGYVIVEGKDCTMGGIAVVLAKATGEPARRVVAWLDELIDTGTASVDDEGFVYCRRMVRAADVGQTRSETGARGAATRWGGDKTPGKPPVRKRSERLMVARQKASHTKDEWATLVDIFGHKCVKCGIEAKELNGGSLCKDHIVPIYAGGDDGILNLQPMCRGCNASKGNREEDYRDASLKGWRDTLAKRLANASQNASQTTGGTPGNTPTSSRLHLASQDLHHQSETAEPPEPKPGRRFDADADRLVKAFDEARDGVFGTAVSRPFRTATDLHDARQWLDQGLTLALAADVFEAGCRRLLAKGKSPPGSMRFFRDSIQESMAAVGRGDIQAPAQTDSAASLRELWSTRLDWLRQGRWQEGLWGQTPRIGGPCPAGCPADLWAQTTEAA